MTYGYVKIYFRMILLVQLLVFVYNIYISALFLLRGKAVFENATLQASLLSGSRYLRHLLANVKFYDLLWRVKKKNTIQNKKQESQIVEFNRLDQSIGNVDNIPGF